MKIYLLCLFAFLLENTFCQTYFRLDATNDGATINLSCPIANTRFADDGSNSTHYSNGVDRSITFCAPAGKLLKFDFGCGSNLTIERIHTSDTLFIYNGNSTSSPLLYAVTGNASNSNRLPYFKESSSFVFLSSGNCITFRLKADASNNDDGWDACVTCVDPISCNDNEPATDLFGGAPYICNFSGYCGRTSGDFGADMPVNLNSSGGSCPSGLNFLGTVENNSWVKFVADSTVAIFDFNVPLGGGCTNGIQTAIFSYNGSSLTRMSSCALSDGSHSGNFQLSASGLTVGNTYYIMTDGNAGDICNYTINANVGVTTVNAGADQTSCVSGGPINLSATGPSGATYIWNSLDGVVVNANGANQTVNPTVSTTYVVEVSGAGVCENKTDTVQVNMCVTLPVNLLGFTAECESTYSLLKWQTVSEVNNDYFIIEKSNQTFNFSPIGQIIGNGNTSVINNYEFQDFETNGGVAYYRLKQVDFNREFEYSEIIVLNKCSETKYQLNNIYYNGTEIVVNYQTNKTTVVMVNIFDAQGKLVVTKNVEMYQHQQSLKIPVSNLISGSIYMVNLRSNFGNDSKKILISK